LKKELREYENMLNEIRKHSDKHSDCDNDSDA